MISKHGKRKDRGTRGEQKLRMRGVQGSWRKRMSVHSKKNEMIFSAFFCEFRLSDYSFYVCRLTGRLQEGDDKAVPWRNPCPAQTCMISHSKIIYDGNYK
mmetsp:Transcript_27538/g.66968  ORF Transcript_27538/g.66968 Transcript_27538/m.66968 type:complete len:100 (-) Transcript_27538:151-450(-)